MLPSSCNVALKEWAVAVRALDQGHQIVLLRKGGIREDGKDFRVIHPEFLLYPTYEHQKEALLKPPYQEALARILSEPYDASTIIFSHWAKVEEVIEVFEQETLDSLSLCHIWTNDYAQSRLHWKPKFPLSVMLLRVYRLAEPIVVANDPGYSGCKSWVDLTDGLSLEDMTPVLSDDEFRTKVEEVKSAMNLETVRA